MALNEYRLDDLAGPPVCAPAISAPAASGAARSAARSYEQCRRQVAPFLRGRESVLGHQRTGVYANSTTIEWARQDGIGASCWQHNWGSPGRVVHQGAHLHRVEIDECKVGGVGVDINHIRKPNFGQWD